MTGDVAQQTGGETGRQHVVAGGGGFGGVQAVRKLRRAAVDITLSTGATSRSSSRSCTRSRPARSV